MPVNRRDIERTRRQAQRDMGTTPAEEADGKVIATPEQNREFDHRADVYFGNCPHCRGRVGIHCPTCKIKITGCNCTLTDRVEDIQKQKSERFGGLFVPDA